MSVVIPYLRVNNAIELIKLYKKVFDSKVIGEILYLDQVKGFEQHKGKIGHAELRIGDSLVYLCDQLKDTSSDSDKIHFIYEMKSQEKLYRSFKLLKEEGTVYHEPKELEWCEISCFVKDKFGIEWSLYYNRK